MAKDLLEGRQLDAGNLRFILGLKLRKLRQEKGLSLTDLAARAGMSVSYLSEIEGGRKHPKPDKLIRLAQALIHAPKLVGANAACETTSRSSFARGLS